MIKVLIIDDSAVVRQVLSNELCKASGISVVGTAVDAYAARDKIVRLRPDVITLDLDMPRMNGLTFLTKLMKYYPLPVIVVSGLTPAGSEMAIRALELGAVDIVSKPGEGYPVAEISQMLVEKIRAVAQAKCTKNKQVLQVETKHFLQSVEYIRQAKDKILAIGASTGGTEAIKNVLMGLTPQCPPILIVQHIPAKFTASFAQRLNNLCPMEVKEARNNDPVEPGVALIAPGDRHMTLRQKGKRHFVEVNNGPKIFHQRPSVDVLFHSVAKYAGDKGIGVLLTGMGSDGARGLLAMRQAGAFTIAQDKESSVVFGMPKEAARIGAAEKVCPLFSIANNIIKAISQKPVQQKDLAG